MDFFSRCITDWERLLNSYKGRPNLSFLEVGCCEGRATVWLLENILTHETAAIECVDIFDNPAIELRFDENMKAGGFQTKVRKIKGFSQIELRKLPVDHYDFIYIDGSHFARATLEDMMLAFRLLKVGGIMVVDDYKWMLEKPELERPEIAIETFLAVYKGSYELLWKEYQVAIKRTEVEPLTRHPYSFYE
jgi:predicted O-methyltransferase YrrM